MFPASVVLAPTLAALLPSPLLPPKYLSLSEAISALLLDGRISPGSRLPSERDLALALGVSRTTATSAYDRLVELGMLTRRQGSGSFLQLPSTAQVGGPGARMAGANGGSGLIDLSVACLPAMPGVIEAALTAIVPLLTRHATADGYRPYGLDSLRERIAHRYSERGLATGPESILVTSGAQHGLDLVLRTSISAGDRVLTELPTYPGALDAITARGGRLVAAPFGPDSSWDLPAIANTVRHSAPRMAYLIPDFHNPTGLLASDDDRAALAHVTRQAGVTVVVDESFIDLDLRDSSEPTPTPFASWNRAAISIGSLSKALWGGLRIGWIRAEPELIHQLAATRARTDMAGPIIDQLVADQVLPGLAASTALRREQLRRQRDTLLAALDAELPRWRYTMPLGGLSTWVALDRPAATALSHRLEQRGILLNPGSRFGVGATFERFVRLPFALPEAQLGQVVGEIAAAWREIEDDPRGTRLATDRLITV